MFRGGYVRIGLASIPVVTGDVEHNVLAMVTAMEQNCGACDLLVFGESVLQGFECLTWDYEKDCHIAVEQEDLPVRQVRQAAQRLGIAVSFGYVERVNDRLFSSQIVIDENGNIVHNFHRVSQGWKAYWHTDHHYCEGERFETFLYGGIKFAIALCGDLWTETRPEEMKRCKPDVVLWPVWCDFPKEEWNQTVKYEYAQQAARSGDCVLYVNPYCADTHVKDAATGGAAWLQRGGIIAEQPAGKPGVLIISTE